MIQEAARIIELGYRYREGDGSFTKPLSKGFSIEVSKEMDVFIVCDIQASETDIAWMQINNGSILEELTSICGAVSEIKLEKNR